MRYLDFLFYFLGMHGIIDPYFFFRISDEDLTDKKNSSDKNISLTLYYFFNCIWSCAYLKIVNEKGYWCKWLRETIQS
jgi:hypothetical protein